MKPKRTSDSYKNKSENSLGTEEIITLREFKNFILRGNVLDLAVGVIIGSAFTGLVIFTLEIISFGKIVVFPKLIINIKRMVKRF